MITVTPLSDACGAEISNIDLTAPVAREDIDAIERAFLDYGVLLFREQPLTPQALTAFSRSFGEIQPHVQRAYQHPDVPEVVMMTNRRPDGSFDEVGARRGAIEDPRFGWHSDLSYDPVPAKATLLHSIEVPSRGGNTCFANVTKAYEALPDDIKTRLDGLTCEFRLGTNMRNPKASVAAENLDDEGKKSVAIHPAVSRHPETGRPAIYANPLLCNRVVELSDDESHELLEALFDVIDRPEFHWEHQWSPGDTLMWDNRGGTMHCGRLDYPRNEARRFIRTTVTGHAIEPYRR